jgi:hypothetical protein
MGVLSTLLLHPDEIVSLLRVRQLVENAKRLPQDPDLAFCYDMLNRVSRSFAVVIQQLGPELRDAVRNLESLSTVFIIDLQVTTASDNRWHFKVSTGAIRCPMSSENLLNQMGLVDLSKVALPKWNPELNGSIIQAWTEAVCAGDLAAGAGTGEHPGHTYIPS